MNNKLSEISKFIELIIQRMPKDNMLIVTGDHGMRGDGNHGGSSDEERKSLLMGVWKGNILTPPNSDPLSLRQRDITATLSLLLDVSLPSNCLGYPISTLLPASLTSNH